MHNYQFIETIIRFAKKEKIVQFNWDQKRFKRTKYIMYLKEETSGLFRKREKKRTRICMLKETTSCNIKTFPGVGKSFFTLRNIYCIFG